MISLHNSFLRTFKLISSAKYLPHPDKVKTGGEDSFFISKDKHTIGVADGVGGWSKYPGANSAKYSRDLMNYCDQNSNLLTPLEILKKAYHQLDFKVLGSTTALICKLHDNNKLSICNIGDSGLSIYRKNQLMFIMKECTHGFNFPKQLGCTQRDLPEDSVTDEFIVEDGDLILAGTDGVWDNIWNEDIEKIIDDVFNKNENKNLSKEMKMKIISEKICQEAQNNGKNPNYYSPFEQDAHNYGLHFRGGKLDDTTIISSIVVNDNEK